MEEEQSEQYKKNVFFSKRTVSLFILGISIVLLTLLTHDDVTVSGNETSRLAFIESLCDRGVFHVNDSRFKTVDIGCIDGKFYCDKPLLYPLYLCAVYLPAKMLGFSFSDTYHDTMFLINWFGGTLFAILIIILTRKRLTAYGLSENQAAMLSSLGVFSTWIVSYGGIINNHVPAAFFLLLLYILFEYWNEHKRSLFLALAGLCAGILFNLEIPTGFFFGAACGLFLLCREKRVRNLVVFAAFFLLPLLFVGLADLVAYGNPLPVYLVPGAYEFEGNVHSSGIAGLQRPASRLIYFFDMLIWHRGFFSYMPALLMMFPALPWLIKQSRKGPAVFFLGAIPVCLIFYVFATGDYGGWAYGFRFLIPIIPLVWLCICRWLVVVPGKAVKIIFSALVVIGIFTSLVGAYNSWPLCKLQSRLMLNTFKLNLYCAAYEYGNSTGLERAARPLMDGINVEHYLPRAFANMRKISYDRINDWPVAVKPRRTVNMQLLKGLLPDIRGVAMMFGGFLFLSFLTLSALRLLPLILQRKKLWLGPFRVMMLVLPVLLLQAIVIVGLCGITGAGLWSIPLLLGAAIWFCIVCLFTHKPDITWRLSGLRNRNSLIAWSIPVVFGLIAFAGFMQLPPLSYDVLTYHLYIPVRWIQENTFIHVPTVFSDNSAAFSPKNWYLLAVTWLNFLPGDSVMEGVTIVFMLFAAAAVGCLISECGGSRKAAWTGAGFTMLCPILFEYSLYAQSDVACAGLLIAGLYWLIRAWNGRGEAAFMGALCFGLAAGMKTAMVPFVILPGILLFAGELRRKRFISSGIVVTVFFVGGGIWYLGNWVLYGNPLFPAAVEFSGMSLFRGAYNSSAVYKSEFHARSIADLVKTVYSVYGPVLTIIMAAGILSWPLAVWKISHRRKALILAGSHCMVWLLVYLFVIPHNMQTRFLFPCLLTAIAGLVVLGSRLRLFVSIAGVLLALSYIANVVYRQKLYSGGISVYTLAVVLMICLIVCLIAFIVRKNTVPRQRLVAVVGVLWLVAAVFTGTDSVSREKRGDFYQRLTGFGGAGVFNQSGQLKPVNVAYSGFNRPYILLGPDLVNRVVYCNVQGSQRDGFFQFWRMDPKLYPTYKPNVYRNRPERKEWLDNLCEERIDYVVLSRMSPSERTYLPATPNGFPLPEMQWIQADKNTFAVEYSSQRFLIYRVNNFLIK